MENIREETRWETVVCLNGQLEIQLPGGFEAVTGKEVEKKFPYGQGPQEIYMDHTGEKIITFNLLDKALEEKQVYSAVREIQVLIGHLYPESIRQQAGCIRAKEETAGWFSFATGGLTEDCIHILFVLSLEGKMMFGSYHFPAGDEAEERKTFQKIIRSAAVKKKKQEKAGGWYVGGNIWG